MEINLKDEKLMHTHRFLLFDRPKPPKNVEIVDYDMEKGSAILEKKSFILSKKISLICVC